MPDALAIQVPAGHDFGGAALFYNPAVSRGSLITALPRLDAATGLKNLSAPDAAPLGVVGNTPVYQPTYATVQSKFSGINTGVVEPDALSLLLVCRCLENFDGDATKIPVFAGSWGDDPGGSSDFGFYVFVTATSGGNATVRASVSSDASPSASTATIPSASLANWRCYEVIASGLNVSLRDRTAGTTGAAVVGTGTRRRAANTILVGRDRNGAATRQGTLDVAGIRLANVAWTGPEAEAEYQRMKKMVLRFNGITV